MDTSSSGQRAHDICSRLLKDRIIWLGTPIDDETATVIIAQMLFLSNEDSTQPVNLYVSSPGGLASAALAVLDTMDAVAAPIHTYGIGCVGGSAVLIVAHGAKGHRTGVAPVTFHVCDVFLLADSSPPTEEDVQKLRRTIAERLSRDTGRSCANVLSDMAATRPMTGSEAVEYGIIDFIVQRTAQGPSET